MAARRSETSRPSHCDGQRERRAPAWREKSSSSFPQTPSSVVQKKIFQAGLGDVNVAQFHTRRRSQARDFGDARYPTIRVQIGSALVVILTDTLSATLAAFLDTDADLGHARQ